MNVSQTATSEQLTKQAVNAEPVNLWYGPKDVSHRRPRDAAERRAVGLGWFSIGLGLTQLLAPRSVARLIASSDGARARGTMRLLGLREIAGGVGILMQPRPNTFLWGRVAGDIFDLALLTDQMLTHRRGSVRLGLATATVLGVTALDVKTAMDLTRARRGQDLELDGIHVKHAITINAPRETVYAFWRDLQNLPTFMEHLESVQVHGDKSTWRARAPMGTSVEWEATITSDEPNARIEWCSLPGSSIENRGSVVFLTAPGDRGTEVHVELTYHPPGGAIAAAFAKLFGEEPKQQIKSDLRRLKQVMETGEVMHSDASIHHGKHAARPSEESASVSSHQHNSSQHNSSQHDGARNERRSSGIKPRTSTNPGIGSKSNES
jgi:uncharacterized membrane protein